MLLTGKSINITFLRAIEGKCKYETLKRERFMALCEVFYINFGLMDKYDPYKIHTKIHYELQFQHKIRLYFQQYDA